MKKRDIIKGIIGCGILPTVNAFAASDNIDERLIQKWIKVLEFFSTNCKILPKNLYGLCALEMETIEYSAINSWARTYLKYIIPAIRRKYTNDNVYWTLNLATYKFENNILTITFGANGRAISITEKQNINDRDTVLWNMFNITEDSIGIMRDSLHL